MKSMPEAWKELKENPTDDSMVKDDSGRDSKILFSLISFIH